MYWCLGVAKQSSNKFVTKIVSLISAQINFLIFFSAAQCIQNKNNKDQRRTQDIQLRIGAHDLLNEAETFITEPERIFIHPEWNVTTMRYYADIAVMILKENVPYTRNIRPVCITNRRLPTTQGYLAGWTDNGRIVENLPRQAAISHVTNEECFLNTENYKLVRIGSTSTFCALRDLVRICEGKNCFKES